MRNVFILVQLNVHFLMFLEILLAQHVSDVTAFIVRSTTVVFSAIGFWFLVCLVHAILMVLGYIVTVSRSVSDSERLSLSLKLTVIQ
jgi:hypothetical protein